MVTSQAHIVMPRHVNGANRLFGGQLMAWIDVVAAIAARRHTNLQVTTVGVDSLRFISPAFLDETVWLNAFVTWTGKTSLEVRVDSFAESLLPSPDDEAVRLINQAYLVFVALGADGKPSAFKAFEPKTDEEWLEWERAKLRRERRIRPLRAEISEV
jgi:acyl-CoA hydrolase